MAVSNKVDPKLLKQIPNLSLDQQKEVLGLLEELDQAEVKDKARNTFMGFCNMVWPAFIEGRHHKIMADAFERVARGELKRLIINMPPRHTKSEFASYLLPSWFLGNAPGKKVIQASHTAELSVGFGRKVRNLVDSDDYKSLFPSVGLRADSKAAGRWSTNAGGEYFAIGVGGAVTGKGADLLIIDDPHSEQEGQSGDPSVFDKAYEWYTSGPRQRLQPGGAIIIVMCMTGDTPVLMANGIEKALSDIQVGDQVATYSKGKLTTSTVNNHQSSGLDTVYTIQTQSGRTVRANKRHPFLVERSGKTEWIRLKNLKPGDLIVSLALPLNTDGFTTDKIKSIFQSGVEEVFDVEIDRTENFIANGLVSHNTRWHKRDLTGQIIKSSVNKTGTDEWEVIEFPAIMPSETPLWPEFWPMAELVALREELPPSKWNAQYQQNPTSEGGALVKRSWWRIWEHKDPPVCEFIIQSWDTAFLKTQRADYSACTAWGVFYAPDSEGQTVANIILLDAFKDRLEFPDLKKKAYQLYVDRQPDACIIEAKAAGTPLIFELRAMGIPVSDYTPSRGNDKISRVNAVSDLFASGIVWRPETRFAEEVVEEFAAFPNGEHDDLVDSSTQALLRFRQGGFLKLNSDEDDIPLDTDQKAEYY